MSILATHKPSLLVSAQRYFAAMLFVGLAIPVVAAQETVCARVKLEIKQELTLERQGFDAEMRINNTTDTSAIENVSVVVRVTDENGTPVPISDNPNDLSAKFFVRLSNKENIANVDGTGVVNPKTTGVINWLLIPAPGAAGNSALGKKYLVGATLKYKFGAEDSVLEIDPDVITVKPLPLLTLDYFLTKDVVADDPLTPEIEAIEPFTLGVRVRNNGLATAKNLKIDSAQPKIVENNQGLLINFTLTGSYVNDAPVANSLLMDFGDIAGNTSKMGRWNMETTLAGKFTEFTARFTHADELGGAMTSILQATNAHFLIRDVRVDLPGRDQVRDFLAQDGDVIRVYESDSPDTEVTDRSAVATFATSAGGDNYRLTFPATAGFAYVKLPDPHRGAKALGTIMRSDAKQLAPENVWLSKTRNAQTKQWEYWVNFFDVNTTGVYDSQFTTQPGTAQPPLMQFIPDRTVDEGKQVSFLVEASSPSGLAVTISALQLPPGASLTMQAADPKAPGLARAVFDWTPSVGTAGSYPITFRASDGSQAVQRMATIVVKAAALPAGPAAPSIDAPLSGATFVPTQPVLKAQASTDGHDLATRMQFELYADESMTQLVASTSIDKAPNAAGANGAPVPVPTSWTVPAQLDSGKRYWWRVRTFDGKLYSTWTYARFQVEPRHSAPAMFNQTSPAPEARVASLTPILSWTNSDTTHDEPVTYSVSVYKDAKMTQVAALANNLVEDPSGTTSWTVTPALVDHTQYYWRVTATRPLGPSVVNVFGARVSGPQVSATPRSFTVDMSNAPPSAPVLAGPALGATVAAAPVLSAATSTDPENDLITYVFEIDSVKTFDSAAKRSSGQVLASSSGVEWRLPPLADNTRYWWRVKAQDAQGESAWVVSHFVLSASNDAPPVPSLRNPGNGSWTAATQPTLETFAVEDPEGDAVRYEFEMFKDAGMTQKVAQGTSPNTALIVPTPLARDAWYWWRARALDGAGAASEWSAPASVYVGTGGEPGSSIALVAPAAAIVPVAAAKQKIVTLGWEDVDPNREASVALYYSTTKGSYAGTLIAEGLRQPVGASAGTYDWDVTNLAPGVYHVYAVAHDTLGSARAYAPGPVVVPNTTQAGTLKVLAPANWYEGGIGTATVSWTGAAKGMLWPMSGNGQAGAPLPAADTAAGSRSMTLMLPYQCSKEVPSRQQVIGPVVSEDPNFAGRIVTAAGGVLNFAASNTGNESLRVCDVQILSSRVIDAATTEYVVTARLSNLGTDLAGANVVPMAIGTGMTVVSGVLKYGAIGARETGTTDSVIVVRTAPGATGVSRILQKWLQWSVQVMR